MCVLIVACNLGVIEALYQMNRRSGNRRLTRYPAELSSSLVTTATETHQQHVPLRDSKQHNNSQQHRRLQHHESFSHPQRRSIEMDNSSYSNSSTSRHHLSVRQRDSSGSSSTSMTRRHHHRHHDPNNQTQEEIKFARLMAVLCIFYVLCWIPQLVRPIFNPFYFYSGTFYIIR